MGVVPAVADDAAQSDIEDVSSPRAVIAAEVCNEHNYDGHLEGTCCRWCSLWRLIRLLCSRSHPAHCRGRKSPFIGATRGTERANPARFLLKGRCCP